MRNQTLSFADLNALATHLRTKLDQKEHLLLFTYNGTGKTRLSTAFKEAGKIEDERDTLYFNAFTEDLFSCDNDLSSDLDEDAQRVLKINSDFRFFAGLHELEMDNRIRPLLQRYATFAFKIDTDNWEVRFEREVHNGETSETIEHIKISRGEENIFIWCFFLAVAQLAIDEQEAYAWVKYLYIDDPIYSLDDNNAIAVASHLAQLLKNKSNVKAIIYSHHALFFSVMWNALGAKNKKCAYFLNKNEDLEPYSLRSTGGDAPFFQHVALLQQLHEVAKSGNLYTYHFNILRNILEKTATFHGFSHFSACIKKGSDPEDIVHTRMINVFNHGDYSLYDPVEMGDENKQHFKKTLKKFMSDYQFNPVLFPKRIKETGHDQTG